LSLIVWYSGVNGLDPYLVAGVIKKESGFKVKAVGTVGEKGLMQLRPEYFESSADKDLLPIKLGTIYSWERETILEKTRIAKEHSLFNPEVNIATGTKHLRNLKKSCPHGSEFDFLVCYNRGLAGGKRVTNPSNDKYVQEVAKYADLMRKEHIFGHGKVTASIDFK